MKGKKLSAVIVVVLLVAYFKLTYFTNKSNASIRKSVNVIQKDSSDYIFHYNHKEPKKQTHQSCEILAE